MDNASIHLVDGVTDLIENQLGAWLHFLPPYLPDLNPLEVVFSKIEGIMKQNDALFQACNEHRGVSNNGIWHGKTKQTVIHISLTLAISDGVFCI